MKYSIYLCLTMFILASPLAAEEKMGMLEGTIISRDIAKNEIIVQHGEVKGVMGAMTMGYQVRGQMVATLPKDGMKIAAILHESNGTLWLTDVKPSASHAMSSMQHQPMPGMQHEAMPGMQRMKPDTTADFLMRQASGTSMNPGAAPMHMTMTQRGDWMLMLHGLAFVSQVIQSGPRGGDKFFSTNWIMGMADRPLGGGHLMLRSMLSLEPITVGKKYPELFQTGETAFGRPIVDGQLNVPVLIVRDGMRLSGIRV